MSMPTPGASHQKLEVLVGSWSGAETLHPSPWDPKGGPAAGKVNNRRALDGFAVVQDYSQERGGQVTFRGHGVFGYNAQENCYTMHWWDSMGFPPHLFKGQFEGDRLVLTAASPMGHTRASWKFNPDGSYFHLMEVSGDGQSWQTFMEGTYKK
jgi:hypothetical protein